MYPFTADYKAVVAQIAALGLKGVKFHPEYQSFRIDDKAVYPLYEEIAKAGLPMLFHTGGEIDTETGVVKDINTGQVLGISEAYLNNVVCPVQ